MFVVLIVFGHTFKLCHLELGLRHLRAVIDTPNLRSVRLFSGLRFGKIEDELFQPAINPELGTILN